MSVTAQAVQLGYDSFPLEAAVGPACPTRGISPAHSGAEASRGDARALRLLLQLTERYGESAQTGAEHEMTGAEDLAMPPGVTGFFSIDASRSLACVNSLSASASRPCACESMEAAAKRWTSI